MIPRYAADGVNVPSNDRNDGNPLWRKSAAGVLSLLVHGALLAAFIGYTSSRSLSPVDTAGRAGSAMSVVAMAPPVAESAPEPSTSQPVMLEPPVKTVVAENAEIVVAQKPVAPEKPVVKKSPPRQSKPV